MHTETCTETLCYLHGMYMIILHITFQPLLPILSYYGPAQELYSTLHGFILKLGHIA